MNQEPEKPKLSLDFLLDKDNRECVHWVIDLVVVVHSWCKNERGDNWEEECESRNRALNTSIDLISAMGEKCKLGKLAKKAIEKKINLLWCWSVQTG